MYEIDLKNGYSVEKDFDFKVHTNKENNKSLLVLDSDETEHLKEISFFHFGGSDYIGSQIDVLSDKGDIYGFNFYSTPGRSGAFHLDHVLGSVDVPDFILQFEDTNSLDSLVYVGKNNKGYIKKNEEAVELKLPVSDNTQNVYGLTITDTNRVFGFYIRHNNYGILERKIIQWDSDGNYDFITNMSGLETGAYNNHTFNDKYMSCVLYRDDIMVPCIVDFDEDAIIEIKHKDSILRNYIPVSNRVGDIILRPDGVFDDEVGSIQLYKKKGTSGQVKKISIRDNNVIADEVYKDDSFIGDEHYGDIENSKSIFFDDRLFFDKRIVFVDELNNILKGRDTITYLNVVRINKNKQLCGYATYLGDKYIFKATLKNI